MKMTKISIYIITMIMIFTVYVNALNWITPDTSIPSNDYTTNNLTINIYNINQTNNITNIIFNNSNFYTNATINTLDKYIIIKSFGQIFNFSLNETQLNNTIILISQKYNDTSTIISVNNSLNALISNINNSLIDKILNVNDTLNTKINTKLNITDQRYNESSLIIIEQNSRLNNDSYLQSQIDAIGNNLNYSQYTNVSNLNVNTTTLNNNNGILNIVISFFTNLFYTKTEIQNINTTIYNSINNKLDSTDQRYNETIYINTVNNTLHTEINNRQLADQAIMTTVNSKLNITDQQYNETNYINNINNSLTIRINTKLNITDQRYNESNLIYSLLQTNFYNYSTIQVITGTPEGNQSNILKYDDISFNVSETLSDLEVLINFTNITSFNQVVIRYGTVPGETHSLIVYLYDFDSNTWESYNILGGNGGTYLLNAFSVFDSSSHIRNGTVSLRLYTSNLGGFTDKWRFDWISISNGISTPSSIETDPLSVHVSGDTPLTNNWNAGNYNITANYFIGLMDSSNITNSQWLVSSNLQDYTNKSKNEEITGNWKFSSGTNTTFSNNGQTLFYNPVFFYNTVTMTNTSELRINSNNGTQNAITIKDLANNTIGFWKDNSGTSYMWTNGIINTSNNLIVQGSLTTPNIAGGTSATTGTGQFSVLRADYYVKNSASIMNFINDVSGGMFVFKNNTNTYMIINGTSQNVGIGTITPNQRLSVQGNVSINGSIIISKSIPFYIWYFNSSVWDCYNGTGTIYNRGNTTLTC